MMITELKDSSSFESDHQLVEYIALMMSALSMQHLKEQGLCKDMTKVVDGVLEHHNQVHSSNS